MPTPSAATLQQAAKDLDLKAFDYEVTLDTSAGPIRLSLDSTSAPGHVRNILALAQSGYYDGVGFHRIIKGFMIPGGCPAGTGTGGPGYKFEDEKNDFKMVRGMIAMANSGPNTNGSQFFIVTMPNADYLTGKHTIFGKVVSGMETVDKIEAVKTTGEPSNRPLGPVIVNKVTVK